MSASLSTHVLDTGRGEPARAVLVEVFRSGDFVSLRGVISGTTTSGDQINTWYLSMLEIHDGRITTEWALVNRG